MSVFIGKRKSYVSAESAVASSIEKFFNPLIVTYMSFVHNIEFNNAAHNVIQFMKGHKLVRRQGAG